MSSSDYVAGLLAAFGQAFTPFQQALNSRQALSALLSDMGWDLDPNADMSKIQTAFQSVVNDIQKLSQDSSGALELGTLGLDIGQLTTDILSLATSSGGGLAAPFDKAAFWKVFPRDLLDYLVYRYLQDYAAFAFGVIRFLGVFREEQKGTDTATARHAFTHLVTDWTALPSAISGFSKLFPNLYGWGSLLDYDLLIDNFVALLNGFNATAMKQKPNDSLLSLYFDPANAERNKVNTVVASPVSIQVGSAIDSPVVKLALAFIPIPPDTDATAQPVGFAVFPLITGNATLSLPITDNISISSAGDFQASFIREEVRPSGAKLVIGPAKVDVDGSIQLLATRTPAWVPVGDPQSTRLEIGNAHATLGAKGPTDKAEFRIEIAVDRGQIIIDVAEGDNFLQTVLGGQQQRIDFKPGIAWSSQTGFSIQGQSALEANFPIHFSLAGIFTVDTIYVAITGANDAAALVIAVSGQLTIGPVAAEIKHIGIELLATPRDPSAPGNLGLLDFGFGFKSPDGLGLLIDAGPIVGGGFIGYDDSKKEYSAVIQLLLLEFQISAIAILDTILPDGSKGYSFILILTLQSEEGIPIGFGFTLNGVGGLAGINRTLVLDAIQASVRSHSLDAILFPTDPVAHAPQIISEITTIFPPAVGAYVFGPMLKIGWGDPTVITVSLGLILELPVPLRIALLGIVAVTLPDPDVPVVELHMDVDGTLDFGLKILAIDATIYDSRLVQYSLSGDMAFRFTWADKIIWTLSIGGFNPQFQPPPGFPSLNRMVVSVGIGDNPSLSLHAYVARTSNTVQLGADFELRVSEGGLDVHGYLTFDAVVHFPGFSFVADMTAGVDIKYEGVSLANIALTLELQGTPPWIYTGSATVHVFGCSISKSIHNQIGDAAGGGGAVSQAVMDLLMRDLRSNANWSADLPDDTEPLVSLLKPAVGNSAILVHPMGRLRVHQKILPLKTPISKFGDAVPTDGDYFAISQVTVGTVDATSSMSDATDMFAMGQFQQMADAQLLSAPSYQPAPAGFTLDPGNVQTGSGTDIDVTYDTWIIEDPILPSYPAGRYSQSSNLTGALANQTGIPSVWARGNNKFVSPGTKSPISNTQVQYVITSTDDLSVRYDVTGGEATTQYMANAQLQAYLRKNPQEAGRLQFMPAHEVAA